MFFTAPFGKGSPGGFTPAWTPFDHRVVGRFKMMRLSSTERAVLRTITPLLDFHP